MKYTLENLNQLPHIAKSILDNCVNHKIFAIYGEMGAGKTTLIKELCSCLNSSNIVSSPTFTIINEYEDDKGNPIYHFDLYRLNNIQEAIHIGTEDYLFSNNYCFIEWPEVISTLLPENTIDVKISVDSTTKNRHIEFKTH